MAGGTINFRKIKTMTTTLTIPTRAHLDEFLSRVDPVRGRLALAIDATASRQETWDTAAHLQSQMLEIVAAIGGLDVQVIHYQGYNKFVAERWLSDAKALTAIMSRVTCEAGYTQIRKVLAHVRKEHARKKINALVLVSDACEETPGDLYAEARELGVPCLMFQEGDDANVAEIYREIARITGGAYCKFDSGAAERLADLLKAAAAFAAGGTKALAAQKSEAATLLLTQLKK
jgi:hypothetical protein